MRWLIALYGYTGISDFLNCNLSGLCPKSNFDTVAAENIKGVSFQTVRKFQVMEWKSKYQPRTPGFPLLFKVSRR